MEQPVPTLARGATLVLVCPGTQVQAVRSKSMNALETPVAMGAAAL